MKKRLLTLAAAVCMTVAALGGCKPKNPNDLVPGTTPGLKVSVINVVTGPVENRLSLASAIEPWEQVMVFSKIPGKIVERSAREGQRVAKGDVIAQVNRDEVGAEANNYQVTSPLTGVLAKMTLDAGSMVGPTVPVAMVVNMDVVKATVNVIESEIGKVVIGLDAVVTVPAYPDEKFRGAVSNVLPIVDPMSHTAKVEIRLANPGLRLKPGMSAVVELSLGRHPDAVVIPRAAVIEKMGEKYVFLYVDGVARKSAIETGYDDGSQVEVLKGVTAGDRLVTSDMNVLLDGTKIQAGEAK